MLGGVSTELVHPVETQPSATPQNHLQSHRFDGPFLQGSLPPLKESEESRIFIAASPLNRVDDNEHRLLRGRRTGVLARTENGDR